MVPATQCAWRQERRTERRSDSEASKWIFEKSNWELGCKMWRCI